MAFRIPDAGATIDNYQFEKLTSRLEKMLRELAMLEEERFYQAAGLRCCGFYCYDEEASKEAPRPGLLVVHAWRGQDEFARSIAKECATWGYAVLAVDLYGEGQQAHSDEEALALMSPLFADRTLLQERMIAAYNELSSIESCLATSISCLGFCFGGLATLELLRSGTKLHKAITFHAVLGYAMGSLRAEPAKKAAQLQGSVLLLHGYEDPLVTQEDLLATQKEFNDAAIDWQLHIYGGTKHAFTNPQACQPGDGLVYDQQAAQRAFQTARLFLNETN